MAKEGDKRVKPGAFIIRERADDPPLFDFSLRVPGQPAPPDQAKLAEDISRLIADIDRSGVSLLHQNDYIKQIKNLFFKGCVKEVPETAGASRELRILGKRFLNDELIPRLAKARDIEAVKFSMSAAFLAIFCAFTQSSLFSQSGIEIARPCGRI